MSSFVRCVAMTALVWLWTLPAAAMDAPAQECGARGDWKDIYVLPSNPNPDSAIKISLHADKRHVRPGDPLALTFATNRDCYLTIMDMGTSGRIVRLWPNEYSGQDNFVKANSRRQFPSDQDQFRFTIAGPDGTERIIAYATTERGRILSEEEFRRLRDSGFKEFSGDAKDLALTFERRAQGLGSRSQWGTAQVNLCVGSGSSGPEPDRGGNIHLLAVGATTGKLKYCESDARRFADAVVRKLKISQENVRMLLGADATQDGFIAGLDWLAARSQPEDWAIVFFSGHGSSIPDQPPLDEPDGRDECFVLYHAPLTGRIDYLEAIRRRILMLDDDFNRRVKKITARKKILVADCCHSGTIHKAVEAGSETVVVKYYPFDDPVTGEEMLLQGPKATPTNYGNDSEAILAACLDNQQSYEIAGSVQSGLFTYHLITAISRGAADLDKAFQIARQGTETDSRKLAEASQGRLMRQTPCLTDPHGYVKLFRFQR